MSRNSLKQRIFTYRELDEENVLQNLEELQENEQASEPALEELESLGIQGRYSAIETQDQEQDEVGSEVSDEDDDEWDDNLVYVELDDVQNLPDLFKIKKEGFPERISLTDSKRTNRGLYGPIIRGRGAKEPIVIPSTSVSSRTHCQQQQPRTAESQDNSKLEISFHNFTSEQPILEFNGRYYTGKFEDTYGTGLIFQTGSNNTLKESIHHGASSSKQPVLRKLTTDLNPPPDPVFGLHLVPRPDSYQLVGKVTKILKMKRTDLHFGGDPLEKQDERIRTYDSTSDSDDDSGGKIKQKKQKESTKDNNGSGDPLDITVHANKNVESET